MIEALTTTPIVEPRRAPRQGESADFSYALASAALESRAGTALQAFGASAGASEVTGATTSATRADRDTSAQTARTTAPAQTAPEQIATAATEETTPIQTQAPGSPTTAQTGAAPVAAPAVQSGLAPSPLIVEAAPAAARTEATALRDAAAARTQAGARIKVAPAAHPERPAPTDEFARLLARRLENGITSFELRLDPPELGRVGARLALDAHGRAELALSFDNQSALDLFRRDEAGLRALLSAAGFDLGNGDLAFSLDARSAEAGTVPDNNAQILDPTERANPHAPLFSDRAAVSSGVVDLFT